MTNYSKLKTGELKCCYKMQRELIPNTITFNRREDKLGASHKKELFFKNTNFVTLIYNFL